MAHLKTISYIDAIEKQMRADDLADHASVLEVVEAEHNEMLDTMKELKKRISAVEVNAAAEHRHLLYRIEKLEQKVDHQKLSHRIEMLEQKIDHWASGMVDK